MGWFTGIAIFGVLWWVVLFVVLPFGIRNQREVGGEVAWGTDPGAPVKDGVRKRMLVTTGITAVLWLIFYGLVTWGGLSLDSVPFLPDPGRPLETG